MCVQTQFKARNVNLQIRVSNGLESAFSHRRNTQTANNSESKVEVIKLKRFFGQEYNPGFSALNLIFWQLSYTVDAAIYMSSAEQRSILMFSQR